MILHTYGDAVPIINYCEGHFPWNCAEDELVLAVKRIRMRSSTTSCGHQYLSRRRAHFPQLPNKGDALFAELKKQRSFQVNNSTRDEA